MFLAFYECKNKIIKRMAKVKYYYDSETLSYRKIEPRKGRRLIYILLGVLATFTAGFVLLLFFLNLPQIQTPKEKSLQRELSNMKLQYQVLNKKMKQTEEVMAGIEERDNNIYRVYFESNPIPDAQRQAGFGGVNRYKDLEGYDHSDLIMETSKRMDILQKRLVVGSKSLDEIAKLASNKEKLLAAMPAIQPIENKDLRRISSGYGVRYHPILKIGKMHNGIDFASNIGANIYATADGVVTEAAYTRGYGRIVKINHGFGFETRYAHMSKIIVKKGEKVTRGQIIGLVGNSGLSSGPHVHYEIWKNGKTVNPINYFHGDLTPEEYTILLERSSLENQSMD